MRPLRELRRLGAAAIAVILGVSFVACTLLLSASLQRAVEETAAAPFRGAAVVVTSRPSKSALIPVEVPDRIRSLPGVSGATVSVNTTVIQQLNGRPVPLSVLSLPTPGPDTQLLRGRLPSAPDEVVLNDQAASLRRIEPGQTITVQQGESALSLKVVGVLSLGQRIQPGPESPTLLATDPVLFQIRGRTGYDRLIVQGSDAPALRGQIAALPGVSGSALTVRSGAEEIAIRVREHSQATQIITTVLLGFAAVSMFVGALVIANTFAILIAQRTRHLGLLRCIGATRRQVFNSVLVEAVMLGGVASVFGIALGAGLAAIGVRLAEGTLPLQGLAITWWSIAIPLLVGVLVTVVAAVRPASRATAVAPLAALRPVQPLGERGVRIGRSVLGGVLFLIGAGGLILGAMQRVPAVGIAAGMMNFIGLLLLTPVIVPALVRSMRGPLRGFGPIGKLAVGNARRNRARAAATASALLVGVTLISMMLVAGQSGQNSARAALDRQYPFDAQISSQQPVDQRVLDRLSGLPGVRAVVPVTQGPLTVAGVSTDVTAVPMTAADLLHRRELVAGLGDGVLLAGRRSILTDGQSVRVAGPGGEQTLRVRRTDESDASLVTAADGVRLGLPPAYSAWLSYRPGADPSATLAQVTEAVGPGAEVVEAAGQRAELTKIATTMMWVVTSLLAVAVLIALVGVGNTLSLSVLERTRESGLLRAIGVTRRGLRRLLGLEAVTLALVASVLGVGLGTGYGVAAAYALLGSELRVEVSVPWLSLVAVTVAAVLAGLLAAVIPATRAARVPPAAALAEE